MASETSSPLTPRLRLTLTANSAPSSEAARRTTASESCPPNTWEIELSWMPNSDRTVSSSAADSMIGAPAAEANAFTPPSLLVKPAVRERLSPTAISYFEDDGRYIVTGSAGGAPTEPQWFRNLRKAEQAVIEVGADRMTVDVAIADDAEHKSLWAKLLAKAPFFGKYEGKAGRVIPMAALTPRK